MSSTRALCRPSAQPCPALVMEGLHLEDVKDVPFGFQTLTTDTSKLGTFYSLKMVKRLYVEKSLNPTTEFVSSVKRPFPSELELVDFKDKTEDTRLQINKSVSDLTDVMDSLPKAITAFGLDLYNKMNNSGICKNIFLSPTSVSSALGIILLGAGGSTQTQMEKVLYYEKLMGDMKLPASERTMPAAVTEHQRENAHHLREEAGISSEFKNLLLQLNNLSDGYQLNLANNLFIQKGHEFLPQYLLDTEITYEAKLHTVDFLNATEETRQTINHMVEKETQGKIKELFTPGVIGPEAVLVLANAIYFKATWQHQFDPTYTTEHNFRLNENESKPVQMMYQRGKFKLGYPAKMNVQILCLPYVGEDLSMVILLPNDISDLKQVEQAMTFKNLACWTTSENMKECNVEMYIPRFKLEDSFDLNITLKALGMVNVFDKSKADLSGLSLSHHLFLSKVMHKAYLEVNEVGTEAAAATGAVVSTRSLVSHELFMVDHPFLFLIKHNPTNTLLFLGKLCCP
ncbi:serpin B5 isoform X2 [Hemicordylus capensis]|uniref:serpin B5 isoform X2 n=1 Tax=Hemicordylus capensis TaxID=884348 RepID=UPI002303F9DD|nr:serpin B5 isoform X2 [Hemicordylus capensis]